MKLGELAWFNGKLAWILSNFQWLKTYLNKYTATKGEWLFQNHCLKGHDKMDSNYGELMMHYKVSRRQIFGKTATWWKKTGNWMTKSGSVVQVFLIANCILQPWWNQNSREIWMEVWHSDMGRNLRNFICFILVLHAHDSYSWSDVILEIIMPQKKSFEMEENYAITNDNVKWSVQKSLSLRIFSTAGALVVVTV